MSKCLVTKLKASVNNDSLGEMGTFDIQVSLPKFIPEITLTNWFIGAKKFKVIGSGGYLCNENGEEDLSGTHLSSGQYTLRIYGKYDLLSIRTPVYESTNWGLNSYFTYDISKLAYSTKITDAQIHGTTVSGKVEDAFGNNTVISTLNIANTTIIEGDFAVMFKRMVKNGRTNNLNLDQSFQTRSNKVTFNGEVFKTLSNSISYLKLIDENTIGLFKSSDNTLIKSCVMSDIPD